MFNVHLSGRSLVDNFSPEAGEVSTILQVTLEFPFLGRAGAALLEDGYLVVGHSFLQTAEAFHDARHLYGRFRLLQSSGTDDLL